MTRISALLALLVVTGCANGIMLPNPDDADYVIRNVQVAGPAQAPGTYTITFDVLVRSDGGGASPVVSLIDQDDFLRFGDDLLSESQTVAVPPSATRGTYPQSALLQLDCSPTFTVIGVPVMRDSGEGRPSCFFCPTDDADVYAQVSRADGTRAVRSAGTLDVRCQ